MVRRYNAGLANESEITDASDVELDDEAASDELQRYLDLARRR